jgi:hypothetical protein
VELTRTLVASHRLRVTEIVVVGASHRTQDQLFGLSFLSCTLGLTSPFPWSARYPNRKPITRPIMSPMLRGSIPSRSMAY